MIRVAQVEKMAQPSLFCSGTELANLVVSSGLLRHSWSAIWGLYAEVNSYQQQHVRWRVLEQPNYTIIAFATLPIWSMQQHLQQGDLVSSASLKQDNFTQFDFLISEGNPSFSIHKAAIALFASHIRELSQLRSQLLDQNTGKLLLETPLIITGHSLGGSIASLFTLWLLDLFNPKLPLLCITFGCPLLGDKGLQRAISESSRWSSCFLHVAAAKDPFPSLFAMPSNLPISPYKPFGAFLFCSELGCTCVEDPEAASELLKAIGLERTRSQVSNGDLPTDYYGKMVKYLESRLIFNGNSQLVRPVEDSISAGIILQMEAIGDTGIQQQQQTNDMNNLMKFLEGREKICWLNKQKVLDPKRKLNEVKIKMAYLEWYKKDCKTKGIGYYDSYKNLLFNIDMDVGKYKKFLANYWKEMVEQVRRKPQKEGANTRTAWLYAGTNYRRMVEPLDIAEYYRESGRIDYQNHGRSKHYILLEQWQNEDGERPPGTLTPSNKKKQNVAGNLTEDSCFWAKVEEALISCSLLRDTASSGEDKQSSRDSLIQFEQYVMSQINNYAVSPEIFLGQSSFMKWWKEYQQIAGTSYSSPLVDFMRNGRYDQYARGRF